MKVLTDIRTELGWAFGIFKRDDDLYELRTSSGGGCINIYLNKKELEQMIEETMERYE